MGKEQKQWRPSRWKPGRLALYMLHVYKTAVWASCQILGEYEGSKLSAQLKAERDENKSVAMLRAKGVALIGYK